MSSPACVIEPITGTPCFAGDLDAAADSVLKRTLTREGGYACLCNVHVLMTADRHDKVSMALRHAWLVFPDGEPVAWLVRRMGVRRAKRIPGADLLRNVVDIGRERGIRHFFFGSSPEVLRALVSSLERDFPGVVIAGTHAPPVGEVAELGDDGIGYISTAAPDIVWVGLGAPKQELWMMRHAPQLRPAILLGVGAAFDFGSGRKMRAPRWMQATGLEWLHRLASEPARLGPRYAASNGRFLARLTRLSLSGRTR